MKYYPTQLGILYGKTEEHYSLYFKALFESTNFWDFEHYTDTYLGMICDFSDAMQWDFVKHFVLYLVFKTMHAAWNQFMHSARFIFNGPHIGAAEL
jgi:hypothetical protein